MNFGERLEGYLTLYRLLPDRTYRHSHIHQVVLSRRELVYQLGSCDNHSNLLMLLAVGENLSDYSIRLMRASLKFELIGSMVFPVGVRKVGKPAVRLYVKYLFEGHYETLDEVADDIRSRLGIDLSDGEVQIVFERLLFVINTCCPCMADTQEIWWEGTYRALIDYAVKNEFPQYDGCTSIWDVFDSNIKSRSELLSGLVLTEKLAKELIKEDASTVCSSIRM